MPDRPPFPIPTEIDPPQFCLQLCIPDDPIWKQVIAGLLFQPAEWFNWQRDDDKSGKELAQVWRKIYNEIDWSNMSCCPDETPKQYRFTENGHYQVSEDGGVTWTDAPTEDPRYSVPQAPPYLPPGTEDPLCTYADSIVELFKTQFVESVEVAATIRDIAAIIAGVVSGILGAIAAPLVYVIYAVLAPAIFAFGVSIWQALFNDDVWDRLRCNLSEHMTSDGTFTQAGVDAIYSQISTDETGLTAYTLRVVIATAGPVGLTNAARAGFGSPSADCNCDDCTCDVGEYDILPSEEGYFGEITETDGCDVTVHTLTQNTNGVWYVLLTTGDYMTACKLASWTEQTGVDVNGVLLGQSNTSIYEGAIPGHEYWYITIQANFAFGKTLTFDT